MWILTGTNSVSMFFIVISIIRHLEEEILERE